MNDFYHPLAVRADWLDCGSEKNTMHCFAARFAVEQPPQSAVASIAAETVYRLFVNGKMIVCEGPAHRESKPGCGWYDEIELAPYLHAGENILAAQVWFWGNGGRNNVPLERGGFLFACPALNLGSGDWLHAVQPALFTLTDDLTSYLYGGYDVGWDARKQLPADWITGNTAGFEPAEVLGSAPCAPFGELFRSPLKPYAFSEILPYRSQSVTEFAVEAGEFNHELRRVECALPEAEQLYPFLRVRAAAGEKIGIVTDRRKVNGGPGDEAHVYRAHRVEYITREGENEFECPDWLFGESVIYTLPKNAEILSLGYRRTANSAAAVGRFESNDALLNRLVGKAAKTLQVCMRGNYMDCPDRERGQWIGDVSGQIPQTFYALDRDADRLTRKAIRDFLSLRDGDVLRGNVPGRNAGELPSQSLNAVSELGMLMTYCFYSGDFSPIEAAYEPIKNYLALWQFNQDGEIVTRSGSWRWFDHKDGVDADVLEYAWLCSAIKAEMTFARLLGKKQDYISFSMSYDWLCRVADKKFWDGTGYKSGAAYDDRAQAMAILSGIARGPQATRCARLLNDIEQATPYMEYYVLEALFAVGMDREAVLRMMRRYKPLAENENSTLWEDFSVLGTRNHAWSGAPLTVACKHLAGISPLTPGFETVLIAPSEAAPDRMDCTLQTVRGELTVKIRRGAEGYAIDVKLPEGCTAVVGLPRSVITGAAVKGAPAYEHHPFRREYGAEFGADPNAKSLLDDEGNPPPCARPVPLLTHELVELKQSGVVYCEY